MYGQLNAPPRRPEDQVGRLLSSTPVSINSDRVGERSQRRRPRGLPVMERGLHNRHRTRLVAQPTSHQRKPRGRRYNGAPANLVTGIDRHRVLLEQPSSPIFLTRTPAAARSTGRTPGPPPSRPHRRRSQLGVAQPRPRWATATSVLIPQPINDPAAFSNPASISSAMSATRSTGRVRRSSRSATTAWALPFSCFRRDAELLSGDFQAALATLTTAVVGPNDAINKRHHRHPWALSARLSLTRSPRARRRAAACGTAAAVGGRRRCSRTRRWRSSTTS